MPINFPVDPYVRRKNLMPELPHSVKDSSAVGDGVVDDTNSIVDAVYTVGANGTVLFPAGDYRMTVNTTINCATLFLFGARLKPDAGVTITLNGPVITAPGQGVVATGTAGTVVINGPQSNGTDINVKTFGAKGDGVNDDTSAINAAISAAFAFFWGVNTSMPGIDIRRGGNTVRLPAGTYKTTNTINLKEGVTLAGAGRFSTIIQSSYNGPLIRNVEPVYYNASGMGIRDLCIQGDKTKTSQVGITILRDLLGTYANVSVMDCGSHGWRIYQSLATQFFQTEAITCGGNGFLITDGVDDWATLTPSNLPTNNLSFYDIHAYGCDEAGLKLSRIGTGNSVMGCNFVAGSIEYNYYSSAPGVGYNIEIENTASPVPNRFDGMWCEDNKVLAHVYFDASDVSEAVVFENFKHFGNGASNYPQKAMIVNKGRMFLQNPTGHGGSYKTYLGSVAPFQVTKATGSVWGADLYGSTMSVNDLQVVDETGASTGLFNNVKVNNFGNVFGLASFNTDFGAPGPLFYETGQAHPYVEMVNFYKGIMFGPGTSAVDAGIYRSAANVLSMMSGDSFRVAGATGETLVFANGTANGTVATTLGSVGPTGSTAGNPLGWLRINVAGTDRFVPYW